MRYFTVRDNKAEGWNEPFPSPTRATAMRRMSLGLQDDEAMRTYASDFSLYETSIFDKLTGRTIGHADPIHVCDIVDLVNQLEPQTIETTPQIGVA